MTEIGSQFAGYRIERMVGRGGMGVVYLATELALARPVALKLVAPELAGDPTFRQRFLRESRIAASIDHAGILPVYAAGEADGELYLANRFVDGTDLRKLLDDGPLPPARALGLVAQVADALDAAHARGLVHRDVKPANVLVDRDDHCYLCDFGLTKQLGEGGTMASGLAGSLDYLAPEQIRRGDVDGATDQYALACVLYELLVGVPPFRRPTEAQTLWAHMQEEHTAPAGCEALAPVLSRALAKEPHGRYPSCNVFVDETRAALGLGPSPSVVRTRRLRFGRRLLVAGGLLLGVAATAVALILVVDRGASLQATPNSVGVLDPVTLELSAVTAVGNAPTEVAVSDDWVWVLNANDGTGTISRLDAHTRQRVSTFSVGGTPRNIVGCVRLALGGNERRPSLPHRSQLGPRRIELDAPQRRRRRPRSPSTRAPAGWRSVRTLSGREATVRCRVSIRPQANYALSRAPCWGPMAFGYGSLWVLGAELERLRRPRCVVRQRSS